jgi:hypothetical protein
LLAAVFTHLAFCQFQSWNILNPKFSVAYLVRNTVTSVVDYVSHA